MKYIKFISKKEDGSYTFEFKITLPLMLISLVIIFVLIYKLFIER